MLRVHLALIFVQCTFGAFHVLNKSVLDHLTPMALAGIRVAIATPLLLVTAYAIERTRPRARDLPLLALLGFLGVFANQVLYIQGIHRTTATDAGILMPTIPVFAAGFAVLLRVERIHPLRLLGVGLAAGGALVMLHPAGGGPAHGSWTGNGLIVVNCLAYALFVVLNRPALRRLPPLTIVAWAFLFGAMGVLPLSVGDLWAIEAAAAPPWLWWALAYIVLIPTALGYALTTWAIRRSSPSLAAAYTVCQPLFAALLALLLRGEAIGWGEATGFVLITGGLGLVSRAARPA